MATDNAAQPPSIGVAPAADTPEVRGGLFLIVAPPTAWTVHFLASYLTAAIWCEKFVTANGSAEGVAWLIFLYTAVALPIIGYLGWRGYCRSQGRKPDDAEADGRGDRYRFLGFASLLLAGLSAVATVYTALVAVFVPTCH